MSDNNQKILFTVPTNFDPELIKNYFYINNKHKNTKVIEVYGALPVTAVGHGRSPFGLPEVTISELREHVKFVHGYGFEFNYLLNGIVSERFKKDAKWISNVKKEIEILIKSGIKSFTIADDFLLKFVRNQYPDVMVNVSLIRGVDTMEEAKSYEKLGVHSIVLNPHTINRNIKRIKSISESVSCQVRLYANISCLDNCSKRDEHYAYVTSCSQKKENYKSQVDPFIKYCVNRYRKNKSELLKSPFIRPEDVQSYRNCGISVFKLTDRKMQTDELLKVINSYMSLKFKGNLFDLIFQFGRNWVAESGTKLNNADMPYIDNSELNKINFLSEILKREGKDLEIFYKTVTERAISGGNFWIC